MHLAALAFSPNPTLGSGAHGAVELVGWAMREQTPAGPCTRALFVLNLGGANATLELEQRAVGLCEDGRRVYNATLLYPQQPVDAVTQHLPLSQLGRRDWGGAIGAPLQLSVPPYAILSVRVA